ncbi:fimbrillin family protein [Bacteroides cellulosilyticus]|uniref:fimbrillin family protein n=1 Tax=Bacteroides cellulosilyticus TaxID=246787 RepID=UPI0035645DDE
MKTFNYHTCHLWLAGFALLLGACTSETDGLFPGGETDTTERPLTVTAQLDAEVETRATTATALETGTMAVYRKATNGYAALNNIPYTWNSTDKKWKSADAADKAKTIYVNHQDAEVYAYYPYDSGRGTNTSFNLAMGRNTPSATMLYSSTQKVNNRTALATFAMKSGYSRITFRLLNMNLPYCLIKSASVTFGSAMKTQGTIDISAATPTTAAGSATIGSYTFPLTAADSIYSSGIGTGQWDETLDLLMIPGQAMPQMTISVQLTLSGMLANASTSVTIPAGTIGTLVQGKQYIIPLLVKGTTISFASNKVPGIGANTDKAPWGEDKLTAYTLPPVTLADGLNVATGNLYYYTSKLIRTSQNPNYTVDGANNWYCFAARNGKQWVEKDQGGSLVSSFSTTNDRCPRLGTNWRMPTKAELQTIASLTKTAGSCNDSGTGAVSGVWVGSYNSGQGNYQKSAVFFTQGTYVSSDGGYLTVTTSGITYSASGAASGLVRCVSTQKY